MSNALVLPDNIPNLSKAKLPPSYEAAKVALAKCEKLDEVKDWADKMAALASYAKQADDRTMEQACTRIRARAIKRVGEIMKSLPKSKGGRPAKKTPRGTPDSFSPREKAAKGCAAWLMPKSSSDSSKKERPSANRQCNAEPRHNPPMSTCRELNRFNSDRPS